MSSAQVSLGAFADQITLELREGAEDVKHQHSPRRGGVDVLGERTEPDAAGCQFADLVDEVAHRAAEPIEFPHDQRVAGAQISQCFGKPVPVGPGTRCLTVEKSFQPRAPQGVWRTKEHPSKLQTNMHTTSPVFFLTKKK